MLFLVLGVLLWILDTEGFYIVVLCIGAAILYGVLHDQVTARVCVEYFTIGHPRIFGTDNPTLLGIGWGILATWWVGLLLGIPLALVARAGSRPKRTAATLIRPIAVLLFVMAGCALTAGLVGFALANRGAVFLIEPLADGVPRARHVAFIADLWAHVTSYVVAFLGGIVVIVQVWWGRRRTHAAAALAPTNSGSGSDR
jgi:hypothetical protein